MALFGTAGPDSQTLAAVARLIEQKPRVLVAVPTEDGWCLGLPDRLVWSDPIVPGGWRQLGWHEIERGQYNAETGTLRWTTVEGRAGSVRLPKPGNLPGLFRDRVNASIVVRQQVEVEGTLNGAQLSGRRNLGDNSLTWHISRGKGTPNTPELTAELEGKLADLRREFG
ncbi:hypothetical protein [Granulicoccus phenolivorans]|uniref:hypothetical protein n=1 Tax=Granulicoccus phenolivorans TaxID=266854 RepID=UPI0004012783|nr:hypothetical protein [Granulicoccus phenolivorans]